MKSSILVSLLLTSCFSVSGSDDLVQGLSPSRQKQKIALLEKKLKKAEKEQDKVKEEVDRLSSAVKEAQLALIRKQVEDFQEKWKKSGNLLNVEPSILFLKERETLYQMVLNGPSSNAFEAQRVLDQILELITYLSDDEK